MNNNKVSDNNIYVLESQKCTGCSVCSVICNQKAITLDYDDEGYAYPKLDSSKCINCGLCVKKCPIINVNNENYKYEKKYYIGNSKNQEMLRASASGAIFAELAYKAIENKYYISGAVYSQDFHRVYHIVSNNLESINGMRGSKYCKSDAWPIYYEILNLVKMGNKVVFSGVGCECAAVRKICENYLDNILLVQIICKGGLSPLVLDECLKWYEIQKNQKIKFFSMRHKEKAAVPAYEYIKFEESDKALKKPYYESVHGKLFASNALLRKSCYHCNFRGDGLVGDIILGDAVEHLKVPNSVLGCSTVVVNSKKGEKYLSDIELNLICIDEDDAKKQCRRLVTDPHKPLFVGRERIFKILRDVTSTQEEMTKYINKKRWIIRMQQKAWKIIDNWKSR